MIYRTMDNYPKDIQTLKSKEVRYICFFFFLVFKKVKYLCSVLEMKQVLIG